MEQMANIGIAGMIIALMVVFLLVGMFIQHIINRNEQPDNELKAYPRCVCGDSTDCDIHCILK